MDKLSWPFSLVLPNNLLLTKYYLNSELAMIFRFLLPQSDKGNLLSRLFCCFLQPAQCRKAIEELKKNFINISQERIALLEVAIFAREKQWDKAIEHLQVRFNISEIHIIFITKGILVFQRCCSFQRQFF